MLRMNEGENNHYTSVL